MTGPYSISPQMYGLTLTKTVYAIYPETKGTWITAFNLPLDNDRQLMAQWCLPKPLNSVDLGSVVCAVFGRSNVGCSQ